jgi:hypothetical protein
VKAKLLFVLGAGLAGAACQPNTTRPSFTPVPDAAGTEVRLLVPEATRQLAQALRDDSIPIRQVQPRDGYIESGWFTAQGGRAVRGSHAVGSRVVRVRGWADPARPGSSQLTVETLYRPVLDPSLPERELERQVARDHPVAVKVEAALKRMVDRFGGEPGPQAEAQPAEPAEPRASTHDE